MRRVACLLVAAAGAAGGCSDGRLAVYPVAGQVLLDGKPAAGATVLLIPQDGPAVAADLRPTGYTGADGRFDVTTYVANDGAPAGAYAVTVTWAEPPHAGPGDNPDQPDPGAPHVVRSPAAYSNPKTSGLTATVAAGPNALPPFDLRSRRTKPGGRQ